MSTLRICFTAVCVNEFTHSFCSGFVQSQNVEDHFEVTRGTVSELFLRNHNHQVPSIGLFDRYGEEPLDEFDRSEV